MEVHLALLYGGTVAIRNELTELQQSVGATSYQIGEELEACFFFLFHHVLHALPQGNIKKYSQLVLLSPSIYHYKGKVPGEYLTVSKRPSPSNHTSDVALRKSF